MDNFQITSAALLKIVRETGKWADVSAFMLSRLKSVSRERAFQIIERWNRQLIESNLIEEYDNGRVRVTETAERIIGGLDLSLTAAASFNSNAMIVHPIFGPPKQHRSPASLNDLFVLMPFSDEMSPVYFDYVIPVCKRLECSVARADDFFGNTSIMDDVWDAINNSKVVVADCTGRNPNVFYEIGIAHTLGKPTILLSQSIEDVPFDLRHLRCLVYESSIKGLDAFSLQLATKVRQTFLGLPITEFGFTVRTRSICERHGIVFLRNLVDKYDELSSTNSIPELVANEVRKWVDLGLDEITDV